MRSSRIFVLIGISSILGFMTSNNVKMAQILKYQNPSSNSKIQNADLSGVRFEPKSAAHGFTREHFRFSSEIWEASDGQPIFLRREYCGSPKNAEKTLRETLKTAFVIFESRPLRNGNRETTGRRTVAAFEKEPPYQRVIFWTDGEMLYSVESSSFVHALLFEKLFPGL